MEPTSVRLQFREVRAWGQGSEVPSSAERLGEEGGQAGSRRVAREVGFSEVKLRVGIRVKGWPRAVPS